MFFFSYIFFFFLLICETKNVETKKCWSVRIQLLSRTVRLGLSLKSTWIDRFSSRQKRKFSPCRGSDSEAKLSLVETLDENGKGSEHVSRTRERLELSAPWVGKKQHDLFWTDLDLNWRSLVAQVGHNKSPMVLGQFAVGSDCVNSGLHGASPGSILLLASVSVWVFGTHTRNQDVVSLISFFLSSTEEVPRHSQTRRDQVGTSNWVEALQILTHLLIYRFDRTNY